MGGCVTVVVREASGAEHKMLRWTNTLPEVLTDPRLYTGQADAWLADYRENYQRMADDYQAHKDDGAFEYNMTPVFFPWNEAAPSEYGLVCVDLKSKTVLSMQQFCTEPEVVGLTMLHRDRQVHVPELVAHIRALVDAGVISTIHVRDPKKSRKWTGLAIEADADKALAFEEIVGIASRPGLEGYLRLTPPGFTIQTVPVSLEGALALKGRMEELGFAFSRKEAKVWAEWADRFLFDVSDEEAASWRAKFVGREPGVAADVSAAMAP